MSQLVNWMMLNVNFYAEDENVGDGGTWAFWVFVLSIAGMVLMVYAGANFMMEWKDYRLFYDASALDEKPDRSKKKRKLYLFAAIFVAGLILFGLPLVAYRNL